MTKSAFGSHELKNDWKWVGNYCQLLQSRNNIRKKKGNSHFHQKIMVHLVERHQYENRGEVRNTILTSN